jgi:hypothetical protein
MSVPQTSGKATQPNRRLSSSVRSLAVVLATVACARPGAPLRPVAAPTPTKVIGAIEVATPTPAAARKKGKVWEGTINAMTSRQYMDKGATVNTCTTRWVINVAFLVTPNGEVAGYGEARLPLPLQCTPHALSGNTATMRLTVTGTRDSAGFNLRPRMISYSPRPSGELGGFTLLFATAPCLPSPRTLEIRAPNPSSVQANLQYAEQMTGCGGSGHDIVRAESLVDLKELVNCADSNPQLATGDLANLCL